jgi:hypothetical protein
MATTKYYNHCIICVCDKESTHFFGARTIQCCGKKEETNQKINSGSGSYNPAYLPLMKETTASISLSALSPQPDFLRK